MGGENKRLYLLLGILGLLVPLYLWLEVFSVEPGAGGSSQVTTEKKKQNVQYYSINKLEMIAQKAIELKKSIPRYEATSDPFGGYEILKLTRRKEETEVNQNKAPVQTQLRLLGIIYDDKKPYALVTHANGKSFDVVAGAVVEDEKIIEIQQNHIVTQKEGVKFELTTSGFKKIE